LWKNDNREIPLDTTNASGGSYVGGAKGKNPPNRTGGGPKYRWGEMARRGRTEQTGFLVGGGGEIPPIQKKQKNNRARLRNNRRKKKMAPEESFTKER